MDKKKEFEQKLNQYEIWSDGIDDDNEMLKDLIKDCREFLVELADIEGKQNG